MSEVSENTSQLDTIFPAGKTVTVQGESITIKPFKFGQLPTVFRLLEPITSHFAEKPSAEMMGRLLANGGEHIVALVSFAIGKPREWFDTIESDEGLVLVSAVIEVNYDFFIQKVLPAINPVLDKMAVK